jgi:MerR family transcriptional regulator, copper efflux regulator
VGLVVPSARSAGGFRLYTEGDVARAMTVRGMKPLGFTLDEMRQLLDVLDALDAGSEEELDALAVFHQRASQRCEELRRQLADAEALTSTLAPPD